MFNTIKVNNTDTNYTHSIFDISEYNSKAIYANLSAALAAVPQNKKQGGMTVKFIQQVSPARYSVVKTENLETEPTGTLLSEAPYIDSGTYDESQLSTIFSILPSSTGASHAVTYYVAVTVDETTTYTSWIITKVLNSVNKYVQYCLMTPLWSVSEHDWQSSNPLQQMGQSTTVAMSQKAVTDVIGPATEVESNTYGSIKYNITSGEKYKLVNLLNTQVAISHRDTPDGQSSDITYLHGNGTEIWKPKSNGEYLRYSDPCHFTILNLSDGLSGKVEDALYSISTEKTRAEGVESQLQQAINTEKTRAEGVEAEIIDIIGSATEIETSAAGVTPYKFVANTAYIIKNLGSAVTISHRDTPDGQSSDIVTVYSGTTVTYTPTSNGEYLRYGDPCHLIILKKESIPARLNSVEADLSHVVEDAFERRIITEASGTTPYKFVAGKKYYFVNLKNNSSVTLSFRDSLGNIIGSNFSLFESMKKTAPSGAVSLRYGDACDILILPSIKNNDVTIEYENYSQGVIKTDVAVGSKVDVTTLLSSNGHYIVVPCLLYDELIITTTGGSSALAACFTDENYVKVWAILPGRTLSNDFFVSPTNGYCIINTTGNETIKVTKKTSYREEGVKDTFSGKKFTSNVPDHFKYHFVKGEKYIITNLSDTIATFGIKAQTDGTLYNRVNIEGFGGKTTITAEIDANYLRCGEPTTCVVELAWTSKPQIDAVNRKLFNYGGERVASVRFDFDNTFIDCSDDLQGVDFVGSSVMEDVYAKFDSLLTLYGSYITKVDAAEDVSLSYPAYANLNGQASGDYLATPTYRTYLYKLIDNNPIVNKLTKKKKLFIFGGSHGNETAAPFNLYLLAKNLCEASIADYFALRSAYDIYIIPCLNGYGMYHRTRYNANYVNINRNFPIAKWVESGYDGRTNPYSGDWTGPSAGSEFETQIVMQITNKYAVDILIDHHNYSILNWQFYVDSSYERFLPLVHQSLVDCSKAFIKNLPYYFGTKYKLFFNIGNASMPNYVLSYAMPCAARWGYEQSLPFAATIEISQCINYINGEYDGLHRNDDYGPNTFAVGEFTLRNQLCRYGGFVLGNTY